ncbi:uncharacterized protein [Miscanthus floridulus]|uniref:uncharacterized protein isoform X1 n=1 Tax=Miscanthus floridulus TaxID=154761 RepID=UPI00345B0C15
MADSISEMQSGRKIEGDLDDLIQHLQIREDEDQGIVLEEDLEELKAEARWTALAKKGSPVFLKERAEGVVEGIQISSTAPKINHLLFADDSLLFCKAAASNARVVQESLVKYCEASGEKVNLAKSSIFFSKGCKQTIRDEIKAITHVENESLNERYLGLPTDVGRTTNGAFKYLKDRVWNKARVG